MSAAHRDAHRILHELDRGSATVLCGIENMAGQICPSCGETTPLFTAAPDDESIWTRIPRLASIPFGSLAARDADAGKPVMITRAVPEQVAAYESLAQLLGKALGSREGRQNPS